MGDRTSTAGLVCFVADSLEALRRETPGAHADLCRAVGQRVIRFRLGADRFDLRCQRGEAWLSGQKGEPAAWVDGEWADVVEVVEGRTTLIDQVLEGRISVRGPVDALLAIHDAIAAYMRGAAAGAAFPDLWRKFAMQVETTKPPATQGSP